MEEHCIILHRFVDCNTSSALEHSLTYEDQLTKNRHLPKQKRRRSKISKFSKMEKWTTFLAPRPKSPTSIVSSNNSSTRLDRLVSGGLCVWYPPTAATGGGLAGLAPELPLCSCSERKKIIHA